MNLVIASAVDADRFTAQFLNLFAGAFIGFAIPEVLRADDGNTDGFP